MLTSPALSRVSIPGSLLLVASLLLGCGGKVLVDGQGSGGAGGAGGASSVSATSNVSVTAATGTGGISTGPSTSSVTGSGAGGTMVTTSTTVGAGGASTGPATSSVTSTSSGGMDPVPQVFCNNQPCNDGEVCCFNLSMPTDFCGPAAVDCGDGYIELSCNGPEDCPNSQICCASIVQGMGQVPYTGIACADTCEGMGTRVVCGDAGVAVCPDGTTCKNSMILGNGYKVCRP